MRSERFQAPHTISFIPKDEDDCSSEDGDEEVRSGKILHEQRKIGRIENGGEHGVEEVPWKHELPQPDEVPQYADFHLGY